MLRKLILLCFILGAFNLKAQFTIEEDTLHIRGFGKAQSSDFVDLEVETHIKSTGLAGEVIKWQRITNDLPDNGWGTAVCDILSCRLPETDTGSFYFEAQDSGLLIMHCYPSMVRGNGKMVVRFARSSNPMEYTDLVVLIEVWKPVSVLPVTASLTKVYPNPASNSLVVVNDEIQEGTLEIVNSLGQVVLTQNYQTGLPIDVSALSQGIYSVSISNGKQRTVQQFAKN